MARRRAPPDKAITAAGYKYGYYSYTSAWNDIMGGVASSAPVWAPVGATTKAKAAAMCGKKSFSGGPAVISQWYDDTRDYDLLCSAALKTTVKTPGLAGLFS